MSTYRERADRRRKRRRTNRAEKQAYRKRRRKRIAGRWARRLKNSKVINALRKIYGALAGSEFIQRVCAGALMLVGVPPGATVAALRETSKAVKERRLEKALRRFSEGDTAGAVRIAADLEDLELSEVLERYGAGGVLRLQGKRAEASLEMLAKQAARKAKAS